MAIAIFGDHRQHLVNGRRPERLADVMSYNYTHELVLHFTRQALGSSKLNHTHLIVPAC